MKFNYIKSTLLALALVFMSSCVNDDVNFSTSIKPIVSKTNQSSNSVMEGETITVSLATNKTYKEEMDFKLELISGGQNTDYFVSDAEGAPIGATSVGDGFGSFGYKIEFPAYAETHSFNITAVKDALKESTENLVFQLVSTDNGNGLPENGAIIIELAVENFVSPELSLVLDWDKTANYKTVKRNLLATELDDETVDHSESICGIVDFDIFLNTFSAFAFTGNCPEIADPDTAPTSNSINTSELADGTYNVMVDMWDYNFNLDDGNNGTPTNPDDDVNEVLQGDVPFPFTLTISHIGTFNVSLDVPSLYFSSNTVSNTTNTTANSGGVAGSGEKLVATIEVIGGKYKVYDRLGNLIASEE
jgi:hypothetical protein